MRFLNEKRALGLPQATNELLKISLFWPLSGGWRPNTGSVAFAALTNVPHCPASTKTTEHCVASIWSPQNV